MTYSNLYQLDKDLKVLLNSIFIMNLLASLFYALVMFWVEVVSKENNFLSIFLVIIFLFFHKNANDRIFKLKKSGLIHLLTVYCVLIIVLSIPLLVTFKSRFDISYLSNPFVLIDLFINGLILLTIYKLIKIRNAFT